MKLRSFFALAVLALASTTVRAELICDNCVALFPGTYLGSHWMRDKSTFLGSTSDHENFFVIGINDHGTLTFNVNGARRIELYYGYYTDCRGADGGNWPGDVCPIIELTGAPLIAAAGKRLRVSIGAGQYVVRIVGPAQSGPTQIYSGSVALTRP